MSSLMFRERPAAGDPAGLLVLHHGRGADELDLLGLADALDPQRRLHVVAPRAPLAVGGGYHWYVVPRVGYPDPDTFRAASARLAAFHDELWQRTGITPERTVLGGFSMGAVMSYALGLSAERPAPAGILAFSGFIPTVEGWQPELASRAGPAGVHRPRPPGPGHRRGVRPPSQSAARGRRPRGALPRVRRRPPHRPRPHSGRGPVAVGRHRRGPIARQPDSAKR